MPDSGSFCDRAGVTVQLNPTEGMLFAKFQTRTPPIHSRIQVHHPRVDFGKSNSGRFILMDANNY